MKILKVFLAIFSLFFIMIVLVACVEENSDNVKIDELINFSTIKKDTEKLYTDEHTVDIFKSAIKHAIKVDGIVDVSDPMYKFELAGEEYFLWLFDDEEGSIMNTSDTNTIYKLREKDAKQLKEILNK